MYCYFEFIEKYSLCQQNTYKTTSTLLCFWNLENSYAPPIPSLAKESLLKLYSFLIEKCLINSWTQFEYAVISFSLEKYCLMLLLGYFSGLIFYNLLAKIYQIYQIFGNLPKYLLAIKKMSIQEPLNHNQIFFYLEIGKKRVKIW